MVEWWVYLLSVIVLGCFWLVGTLIAKRFKKENKNKINEPSENLEIKPEQKISDKPQIIEQIHPTTTSIKGWQNIFILLGISCLIILTITFTWGVTNDKFISSPSFICPKCDPQIQCPPCNLECPSPICNTTLTCNNTCPQPFTNFTIILNQTNTSV